MKIVRIKNGKYVIKNIFGHYFNSYSFREYEYHPLNNYWLSKNRAYLYRHLITFDSYEEAEKVRSQYKANPIKDYFSESE